MITVRKIKLIPYGDKEERDRVYKFIRDSQYMQYKGLNTVMSYLTTAYYNNGSDLKSDKFKQAQKNINRSNPLFKDLEFGKGIDSFSAITQKVKKDFSTGIKNGFAKGERSINNYKRDFPLITRGRDLKFSYEDDEIVIKWVNGCKFIVATGTRVRENSIELRHTLHKCINAEYKVSSSSFQFDKNNHLILNLTLDIPQTKTYEPIPNRVCGVDLGIKFPAYVCLGDETYKRMGIGDFNDFFKVRTQMKARKSRLQKNLSSADGSHGRKKKIQALEQFREKEKNFAKTYNHMISSRIVKFAEQNLCEYIHLEKLNKDGLSHIILSNWSYYDLQQKIIYKAERIGIKVKFIDPRYTSQTCSECGHVDSENRETQDKFKCVACGFELNADHNASINIARSVNFVK